MPAGSLSPRPLGSSGMEVSALSLGSWRTFERLPAEDGIAILRAAHDGGISFFDDARYNDETGHAPIPTGYSEVLFGELFRGAGLRRGDTVVANKLWWEFWPGQGAAAELGVAPPCAVQLPYSLVRRDWVEDPVMTAALTAAGAGIIASFCLAGGVLSGKYRSDPATGRQAGSLADPQLAPALRAANDLAGLTTWPGCGGSARYPVSRCGGIRPGRRSRFPGRRTSPDGCRPGSTDTGRQAGGWPSSPCAPGPSCRDGHR